MRRLENSRMENINGGRIDLTRKDIECGFAFTAMLIAGVTAGPVGITVGAAALGAAGFVLSCL